MSSYVRDWLSYLRGLRLGQAASTTGWVLSFTIEDLAWVCRSIGRETGGNTGAPTDAVVAAYVQYAYLHRNDVVTRKDGRKLYPPHTLSDVVLFYSSVVNPSWRYQGDGFTQHERQRHAVMSPWALQAEYPGLLEHVIGLLRGNLDVDRYRGLVEFAECGWGEGRHGPRDAQVGGNCFWYAGGSAMWRPGLIRVVGPAPRSKSKILVPLGLQLAGGIAVALPFVQL
jgi:hypothetical protein